MRPAILLLLIAATPLTASVPAGPAADPPDAALARARAEAVLAEREAERLSAIADRHRDEAGELRARWEAAAEAIAAAEARISVADAEAKLLAERLAQQRAALRQRQAPARALLGGLAMMAQRPPLLALADRGGTDEFVKVRLLLGATMPVVRARTAALRRQIDRQRSLASRLAQAQQAMRVERDRLAQRQVEFGALEKRALRLAERSGLAALGASDVALSRGEDSEQLGAARQRGRSEARVASELASLGVPPPRPFAADGTGAPAFLAYRLPSDAPVSEGFGSVSDSGIRSRGITLSTRRGATLVAPADGKILFAGPYRNQDGVIIIDHGRGWKSLILNAAAAGEAGDKIKAGALLGRALGPISVELSRSG